MPLDVLRVFNIHTKIYMKIQDNYEQANKLSTCHVMNICICRMCQQIIEYTRL